MGCLSCNASSRKSRSALGLHTAEALQRRLHALTSADCTTRNKAEAQRLAAASDGLEARIAELAALEELDNIRLNGD